MTRLPTTSFADEQGCLRHLPPEVTEQMIALPAQYQVVEHKRSQAPAAWPINKIAMLYKLEQDHEQARLDQHQTTVLPKSLLGKAITYALNQWKYLTIYL